MRALLAIGLLIAGGCRTRPLDAAMSASDGGGGDMQPNGCLSHTRKAVALASLDFITSPDQTMGQSVRARAAVPLRPCDVLADFTVDVQPGDATDFVTVTAHAWIGSRDCGPPANVVRAIELEPSGSNPRVAVADGASGGTGASFVLFLQLPTGTACDPRKFLAPCDQSCQCQAVDPRARCLASSGGARCGQPCGEDVECDQTCEPVAPGGVELTCGPPSTGCCAQTCGFGQTCSPSTCACANANVPASGPCACDADCPTGTLCDAAFGRCFNPCTVVGDCPKPEAAACDHGVCSFFVD